MKKFKLAFVSLALTFPLISFAVLETTTNLAAQIEAIITRYLIPIAFALALLYFFWGVAMYIRSAGGEKEEGKRIMIWGVIALFVMSSIWGLVYFIADEIGIGSYDYTTPIKIPSISK